MNKLFLDQARPPIDGAGSALACGHRRCFPGIAEKRPVVVKVCS